MGMSGDDKFEAVLTIGALVLMAAGALFGAVDELQSCGKSEKEEAHESAPHPTTIAPSRPSAAPPTQHGGRPPP